MFSISHQAYIKEKNSMSIFSQWISCWRSMYFKKKNVTERNYLNYRIFTFCTHLTSLSYSTCLDTSIDKISFSCIVDEIKVVFSTSSLFYFSHCKEIQCDFALSWKAYNLDTYCKKIKALTNSAQFMTKGRRQCFRQSRRRSFINTDYYTTALPFTSSEMSY